MRAGTSPSGKMKPLPGSKETMARTFWLLRTVAPAKPAALRVRDENSRPDLVEERSDRHRRFTCRIVRSYIRCHLPEVLIEASGSFENCTPGKKFGQMPTRKIPNHDLFIRDVAGMVADYSAASGMTTSRLVDQINRETAAQEYVLEPLASVGSGFPRLGELPVCHAGTRAAAYVD